MNPLHFKTLGEGKPLLVLHGLFGMLDNWMGLAKALAARRQVWLLDLRNHGRSPHTAGFDYEAMSLDLADFLDQHALQAPDLLGHSMGGKVAMYFAGRYQPERFDRLVVVDIAPRHYPPHHADVLAALAAVELPALQSRQQAEAQMAAHLPQAGVRQFLLKSLYRADDGSFAWRFNLEAIRRHIENVGEALPAHFQSEQPALFVRGGQSGYIRDTDLPLIRQHFPAARLETIPQAAHWVHADAPDALLHLVESFLE